MRLGVVLWEDWIVRRAPISTEQARRFSGEWFVSLPISAEQARQLGCWSPVQRFRGEVENPARLKNRVSCGIDVHARSLEEQSRCVPAVVLTARPLRHGAGSLARQPAADLRQLAGSCQLGQAWPGRPGQPGPGLAGPARGALGFGRSGSTLNLALRFLKDRNFF